MSTSFAAGTRIETPAPHYGGAIGLLARRWLVTRESRALFAIVTVAFAVLAAVVVIVSSFSVTGSQQAASEFGAYHYSTYDSVDVGQLRADFATQGADRLAATVPDAHISLSSSVIRPDDFVKTYVQSPVDVVRYVEDRDLTEAFPGRYSLSSGRWPDEPGEVVVSQSVRAQLPTGHRFTALSGRARFTIVGTVVDSFAQKDDLIVADAGTFAAIPAARPGHEYQPVDAQVTVLFQAAGDRRKVDAFLVDSLPPLASGSGTREENVTANFASRSDVACQPVPGFGAADAAVVSYVPLGLVVVLATGLVAGQLRRRQRADATLLVTIGLPRNEVVKAQLIAVACASVAAIVVGSGLGWLGGMLARATVLEHYAGQPLSPLIGPQAPMVLIAVLIVVLLLAVTMWTTRERTGSTARGAMSTMLAGLHWNSIRWAMIVLLVLVAMRVTAQDRSVVASYLAVAAVMLVVPDIIRLTCLVLPARRATTLVARRLLQTGLRRHVLAALAVASCVAVPAAVVTQLSSEKASDAALRYNRVPAGQIWVQRTGDEGNVAAVAQLVDRAIGMTPVAVRSLYSPSGDDGTPGPSVRFDKYPASAHVGTDPMVVDSAAELRRVVGDRLPPHADAVLDNGGVVDFAGVAGDQRLVLIAADGRPLRISRDLPTVHVAGDQQLSAQFGGALLLSTATRLGLPVSSPRTFIFPESSPRNISAAVGAAIRAGFDSEFVQYDVQPPTPRLPAVSYAFLVALLIGGLAVLLIAVQSQARQLRSYTTRLIAMGMRTRFVAAVLALVLGVVVGSGAVIGVVSGAFAIMFQSDAYSTVVVPVVPIVVSAVVAIGAAAVAAVVSSRRLTAHGYSDDE